MNTNSISKVVKNLGGEFSKNSPTILTSLAVGGLVTTTILVAKATPKAMSLIDEEVYRRYEEHGIEERKRGYSNPAFEEWLGVYGSSNGCTNDWKDRANMLSKSDLLRLTWRCYIPSCAIGLATVFCIVGANSINLRRNAAIASVYSITEAAFKEYQSKVVETIGKNKELKVRDEISADRIKANPSGSNEIIITGKGPVLCYDSLSGRYFKSDIEKIRKIENELNRDLMSSMFLSLNDFYGEIGLPSNKLGDEMGWNVDNGLINVSFSTQLADDETPCLVLNYDVIPKFCYV